MHTAKVYAAVALSVALLQETSGQGYTQGPSGRTPNQPGSCGSCGAGRKRWRVQGVQLNLLTTL